MYMIVIIVNNCIYLDICIIMEVCINPGWGQVHVLEHKYIYNVLITVSILKLIKYLYSARSIKTSLRCFTYIVYFTGCKEIFFY